MRRVAPVEDPLEVATLDGEAQRLATPDDDLRCVWLVDQDRHDFGDEVGERHGGGVSMTCVDVPASWWRSPSDQQ